MEFESEKTPEQKDVEYLQEQLEATHFDPYRYVEKQTLTDSLQQSTKVKPEHFPIAIQESLALLRDAHTSAEGHIVHDLPITSREIDGKFYIIGTSDTCHHLLFREVRGINGYTLEEIFSLISRLSSKENIEVLLNDLARGITSNQVLQYYGLSKDRVVNLTTDQGETQITEDTTSDIHTRNPLKWKKEDKEDPTFRGNSFYRYRMVGRTLLFQYNSCSNEGHTKEELDEFKSELLKSAASAKYIVVDLRLNSGGNTVVMDSLFRDLPDGKKIYVAMGRKTYSSAIHHLLDLKTKKGAILVGTNAGQRPNRFGDHKVIELPNSHLRVHCSYKYFELLPGEDKDTIEPDIKIPVTIEDYKNSTDPLNKWIEENLQG